MTDQRDSESQVITAFEMMWGKYTEPVRLIHRNFDIIAVNEACKAIGIVEGVKCNAKNPEMHKGCKAMEALKTNVAKVVTSERDGMPWTTFWIPVSGFPDYYIHFTNGLNEYMEKLKTKTN